MQTLLRVIIVSVAMAGLSGAAVAQNSTGPDKTTVGKVEEYLSTATRLNRFNGTALLAGGGEILLRKGYGWRDAARKIPNDTASVYQLGSITKTFTGAVILQLLEEGKLSLSDKLSRYFPDYPRGNEISLENLFTHTSGIYDFKEILYSKDSLERLEFTRPTTKERVVSIFRNKPLTTDPGREVHYTNSGYYLLGMIIEKVTGKPFEQAVRERFLKPLGLNRTGFDFRNLRDPGKTTGYKYWKDSVLVAVPPLDSSAAYAAGGMYSTVGDMYRWSRAVQARKILRPETWEAAVTPPNKGQWGYGWGISYMDKGRKLIYQNGNMPGYATFFVQFPQDDITLILLCNVDDYSELTDLGLTVTNLCKVLYNLPYTLPKERRKVPDALLRQYTGTYKLESGLVLAVTFDAGKLFLQATGQPRFQVHAASNTEFFLEEVDARLTFQKDAAGNVPFLIVHQGGDQIARRQ